MRATSSLLDFVNIRKSHDDAVHCLSIKYSRTVSQKYCHSNNNCCDGNNRKRGKTKPWRRFKCWLPYYLRWYHSDYHGHLHIARVLYTHFAPIAIQLHGQCDGAIQLVWFAFVQNGIDQRDKRCLLIDSTRAPFELCAMHEMNCQIANE